VSEHRHQRGHIVDSFLVGDRYATASSRRIFCDVCRVQRWLTVEAELALAQAELDIIPSSVANAIASAARVELIDLDAVKAETDQSGHSLVGLLRVFECVCADGAGQYIHFGATTQDIQDTGQVLEMRDVLDELEAVLRKIAEHLLRLAGEHAETESLGRTHAQPALPMTFGLKVASWLDEIMRHLERLGELRPRVLVAQLFGGTGTMAAFGPRCSELLERFAARLGLGAPALGWHVARDRIAEYVSTLAMVAGTVGRAADEVRTLSRPEFGEVSEAWRYGKVGSSTMPHKRNPERPEQVVVMAKLAAAQVPNALAAMMGDHERDSRALRLEWVCVPDVSHHTLAACEIFLEIVSGLRIHGERLRANLSEVAEKIMSERLMLALADRLGKQAAHELVYQLIQTAREENTPIRDLLGEHRDVMAALDAQTLDEVLEPAAYLGASAVLTRRVVAESSKVLNQNSVPAG
jgi:adenylosuccinate lyase